MLARRRWLLVLVLACTSASLGGLLLVGKDALVDDNEGGGPVQGELRREEPPLPISALGQGKRLLWLSGLQDKVEGTTKSKYLESSDFYVQSYLVALLTARENAPSLKPVLILEGDWQGREDFLRTVKKLGGVVWFHKLSFEEELRKHKGKLPQVDNLWGSFLKVDLPLIMDEIAPLIEENVDKNYILWTDPDVMFEKDLNSNSLPKPRLFSVAPDAAFDGLPENFGVVYANVSAYASVFQQVSHLHFIGFKVIEHANSRNWHYNIADQALLNEIFRPTALISHLPNTYNYRVYWGRPKPLFWSPALPPTIIHFHGPKPEFALCVVNELRAQELLATESKKTLKDEEEGQTVDEQLLGKCGGRLDILQLVRWGFERDGGEYWDEVVAKYRSYVQRLASKRKW
ncbi:Glycosyltransferase [Balamuthia mandrillaris]